MILGYVPINAALDFGFGSLVRCDVPPAIGTYILASISSPRLLDKAVPASLHLWLSPFPNNCIMMLLHGSAWHAHPLTHTKPTCLWIYSTLHFVPVDTYKCTHICSYTNRTVGNTSEQAAIMPKFLQYKFIHLWSVVNGFLSCWNSNYVSSITTSSLLHTWVVLVEVTAC